MKRNAKVLLLYASLALMIFSLVIYHNPKDGNLQKIINETHKFLRLESTLNQTRWNGVLQYLTGDNNTAFENHSSHYTWNDAVVFDDGKDVQSKETLEKEDRGDYSNISLRNNSRKHTSKFRNDDGDIRNDNKDYGDSELKEHGNENEESSVNGDKHIVETDEDKDRHIETSTENKEKDDRIDQKEDNKIEGTKLGAMGSFQNTGITGTTGSSDNFEVVPLADAEPNTFIERMPKEFHHTDEGIDLSDHNNSSLKKILVWNEGYGSKTMGFGFGRAPFQTAKCEVDSCFVTGNRSLVPFREFDAIIFHFRSLNSREMPPYRYYYQRWIFEEVESSSYIYQDISVFNGVFNWTMTYRRDSDVVYTYGRVFARETPKNTSNTNYAEGKSKMAAWFVSNCYSHSRREKFVKALQKYFQVDIYGKCGPLKCPHKDGRRCYKLLEENYKFYLSFENSMCKDYVTEKLFNILKYNVVPVVYGGAIYNHIAPPGSFINALEFPDVKSLAGYLQYLDGNDTAYNEYFRWKGHYKIDNGWSNTAQPFCDLCKKLHRDHSSQVYDDMKDWFVTQGNCRTLKTKFWLKNL